MSGVSLKGFCFIQEEVWKNKIKPVIEKDGKCLKCGNHLKMISKWKAACVECNTKHTIKKPKNFPKNMDDKRNWKATCDECSGTMDFYDSGTRMAYICKKCGNVLEV